eukprot:1867715-Rhodomonas_salina.1
MSTPPPLQAPSGPTPGSASPLACDRAALTMRGQNGVGGYVGLGRGRDPQRQHGERPPQCRACSSHVTYCAKVGCGGRERLECVWVSVCGGQVLVVVKETDQSGKLLRSVGYTETIPAAGDWEMQPDGTF